MSPLDDALRERMEAAGAAGLRLPPRVFEAMGGTFLAFDPEAARLRVRLSDLERFRNPMGHLQGGALAMAVDNCVGPLSYLVARPSATTELTMTYLRPVLPEDAAVEVEAWMVERAARRLVFDARVENAAGEAVALARAVCQVLTRA